MTQIKWILLVSFVLIAVQLIQNHAVDLGLIGRVVIVVLVAGFVVAVGGIIRRDV
jgi:hypothetical protein